MPPKVSPAPMIIDHSKTFKNVIFVIAKTNPCVYLLSLILYPFQFYQFSLWLSGGT